MKILIVLTALSLHALGQVPDSTSDQKIHKAPIPIEAIFFPAALNMQVIVDNKFSAHNRLKFFQVINILANYRNDQSKNEFVTLSLLSYQIAKGLTIGAGLWTNNIVGARPTLTLNYTWITKNTLFVCVPRIDLIENYNLENVAIFEYSPVLFRQLGLYSRIQTLYNYNLNHNSHDRSYLNMRIGFFRKTLRFGVGTNIDFHGPKRLRKTSLGVFVGALVR